MWRWPTTQGPRFLAETDSFGAGERDLYVLKIGENGAILWETTLGDEANETGVAALEAKNGDSLVLTCVSYPGGYEGNRRGSWLLRLDSQGRGIWSVSYYGDTRQWGNDMIFSVDGDLLIAGLAEPINTSGNSFDFWLAKADAETGEPIWSKREGSQYQDDYSVTVVAMPDGGDLVTGFGPGSPMLKLREDEAIDWVRSAVGRQSWVIYGSLSILSAGDGSFAVSGRSYVHRTGDDFDAVLMRLDAEGGSTGSEQVK